MITATQIKVLAKKAIADRSRLLFCIKGCTKNFQLTCSDLQNAVFTDQAIEWDDGILDIFSVVGVWVAPYNTWN